MEERFERLSLSLGLTDKNEIIKLYNNKKFNENIEDKTKEIIKSNGNSLPCLFASLVKYGCTLISKNIDFPFNKDGHRIYIDDTKILYKEDEIYPELSKREKDWFIENKIHNYIPWKCGGQYYKINENNIYKKIADIYNQKTLSGLSGTTDLVLDVMTLFSNYNLKKSLHSNLIWQCSGIAKDHTVYEILVSTIPYGLKYTVNKDAEEFCREHDMIIPLYN